MSSQAPSFGVPSVAFSYVDTVNSPPSLNAATIAYSIVTPTQYARNSILTPLSGDYKVMIGLIGIDGSSTGPGYALAETSALSSTQTVTAGSGILVNITTGNFPSGFTSAAFASIWLQKGAANPQQVAFGYIDPSTQFSCLIMNEPLASAPSQPSATLNSSGTSSLLLNRTPNGVYYGNYLETTRGVTFNHKTTKIPVSPDDGPDYVVTSVRATDLSFAIMSNDFLSQAQAAAGDTWTFTDTDSTVVTQLQQDLYAIVDTMQGNMPLKLVMPPNTQGATVYRLHTGNVQVNVSDYAEKFLKNEPFAIDVNLEAAPLDLLTRSMMNGIQWSRIA